MAQYLKDNKMESKKISVRWEVLAITCLAMMLTFAFAKEYNPNIASFYTSAGKINQPTRVWDGIITPSTGTAQTIDISSAGFTSINSITITAANNTATVTSMPFAMIKSYTTSQITINILASNNQVVSILGATVTPFVVMTSLSGVTVHCRVDGW